jgi:streptomycin 6-kinase
MRWWNGDGAARVLAHDGAALLLERAEGRESLAEMARGGDDDEACRVLCRAVAALHEPRDQPPPTLLPLVQWFRALDAAGAAHGGLLARCAGTARSLLAAAPSPVILHGDIHHGNILDFGERGWLAIDPKGLYGERAFDYANVFSNPDFAAALAPDRLARRATTIAAAAGLDRRRLLQWALAWSGLSAAWGLADGEPVKNALAVAAAAAAEIDRS